METKVTNTIQANGSSTAYQFDGPNDAPLVMLSNSLMSSYAMWEPQMASLTERYRVLRYDTRGHGATETTPGPYSIKLLAEDAAALMDALGIGPVHFVGLSMGGMIAQYLGAEYPDKILSLSLCDTASEMPTAEMWNARIATAEAEGVEGLVESTIGRWFTAPFAERDPESIEFVANMIRQTAAPGYIACASAVRDMSQTDILSRISAPTIIIVGEEDPACTVEQSRVLHEHISGSELVIIPEAAHLSNIEQADKFTTTLRRFLDKK
jgi:3-oxoadipate enol-lactonase